MSIVITDVISQYGAYYMNNGQNAADLMQKLHRPSATALEFGLRPTADTVIRKGTSAMDRVIQPFQKAFTPIGTLTVETNVISLFNLKIDKQEYPDDIVDSWLGFLEGPGVVRSEWPFVRWMLEVHVIEQAKEDFELNEVWAGVYAAPTPGTAGASGTAMDGIKKIFTNNSSKVQTVNSDAIAASDADFCTQVEDWFAAIGATANGKEYRKRMPKIYMNEDLHLKYRKGKRSKYNMNYAQDADLDKLIDFPGTSVMGLASMGTDETFWTTLPTNMIRPLKKQEFTNFQINEYSARCVSIYTDWWTVCSFVRMESVFRNEL